MPNNKWDDEKIENLLRDFPAIRDERPKEEVYKRLAKEETVHKKPKRWMPFLVAALALITFGALLASILGQEGSNSALHDQANMNSSEELSSPASDSGAETAESEMSRGVIEEQATEESAESEEFSAMQVEEPFITAVYPEELDGFELFSIGLTENGFVVPVTYLIPKEQVRQEFGEENAGAVALYERYASEIDEEALGFDDYHPYIGDLEATEEGINHLLPLDHDYDLASATIGTYLQTLTETFKGNGPVAILNENGGPAEFNQVGEVEPVDTTIENMAYFTFTTATGDRYVTPVYGMPYNSAAEAIEAMKTSPNDFHESLIPEGMSFTINETEELIEIEFAEPLDTESLDNESLYRMIEGLALTADSFDKEIKFNNAGIEQWNRFNFTEVIKAPVAPNRLNWNLE